MTPRWMWIAIAALAACGQDGKGSGGKRDQALAAVKAGDADRFAKLMMTAEDMARACPGKIDIVAENFGGDKEQGRAEFHRYWREQVAEQRTELAERMRTCAKFDWAHAKASEVRYEKDEGEENGCPGKVVEHEYELDFTAGDKRWTLELEIIEFSTGSYVDCPKCEEPQ